MFLPGKSHEQKSQAGYSPWRCKELDIPKHASKECNAYLINPWKTKVLCISLHINFMIKMRLIRNFPGGPLHNTLPSNEEVAIRSVVREQRSLMPCGQETRTESRSNIVTHARKTLKMFHIKKKKKNHLKKINTSY